MHRQVADRLRTRILKGELQPGAVLPPMQRLAEEFGTSYFTVQTALTALDAEGFVESRQRVGTIVRHNASVLTCAGLYCCGSLLDSHEFDFYRVLLRQLKTQLADLNVQTEIFLDSRPAQAHEQPLSALVEAIQQRKIQALIVPLCNEHSLHWLARLPVAAAFVTSSEIPNRTTSDMADLMRLALGQLQARGCQHVGLITTVERALAGSEASRDYRHFYSDFAATTATLGLHTRDAWILAPAQYAADKEREGYDQFRALWQQPERPDGILVYPDVAARGVMTAALELGVRVPEDLKLVFHHNTEVDWTCPLAVDWVESDTAAWAAALTKQVQQQKSGEAVAEVRLPYRLVAAGAAGK